MVESLLVPIISIGVLSLIFGALLGFSAKRFAVFVDPKVEKIRNILPGANCGGCGFPGCSVFAEAVAKEEASYKGCPAGGSGTAKAIAETMGLNPAVSDRKVAFIKCNGIDDNIKRNYIYDGPKRCLAASQLATGGNKSCSYSCIGLASCKNACPFNAIKIVDSIAVVDSKRCTACGKCVSVCPKKLIEIVPEKSKVRVLCNSRDKGKTVRENCRAGCMGCGRCQKVCEAGAITVQDNIAHIDYTKCTQCRKCLDKCPAKAIKLVD
jgi:Na+-translocating ferredoxin:NAD+ oxidoreductase RNF subunit RnfB